MRVLGIDTSSSHASVAIAQNGRLITDRFYSSEPQDRPSEVDSKKHHAEILLPLIDSTLKTAGCSLSDITGFAVTVGPGSFTGLRIGLSTVKGLSYGSGVPVIGVSTLHACAARISNFNGQVCAILDARKKELYCALFSWRGGLLERISNDTIMSFEELVDQLCRVGSTEPILLTGEGVKKYGHLLVRALGKQIFLRENENLPTIAGASALLA
ncbi:MAG: tRNA (adenosine(37)-N6)-threonylcarbamoyltransferase complex dimerization subunit type 1 TsaB, partial [Candidatus Binatia bacterium]